MTHSHSETPMGQAEREFQEFIQRGDDFLKIELLRPAISWYKKALELGMDNEPVKQKLAECNRMLAFENKVIGRLLIIAAIIIVAIILF
ncbi:MAG: hypothetical protein V1775_05560 [Bacteroidota bacterium]